MMYLRFLLQQLKVVGMVIVAFFIFPFITFPRRKEIWAMRLLPVSERKWYWWCSDTSETGFGIDEIDNYNYLNSTYGVYEFIKKRNAMGLWEADYERFFALSSFSKWILSLRWLVFRNGAWNYIVSVLPEQINGQDYICKVNIGDVSCKTWRNQTHHGKQSCQWSRLNPRWFRYSVTRPARWYNVHRLFAFIFSFKWYTHYNFMVGHSTNRYLVKMRSFTPDTFVNRAGRKVFRSSADRYNYKVRGNKHLEDY